MSFKLTILGCSSAIPTIDRNPTAQLLNVNERFFLIDCGEGTQVQLRKYQLSFQRINHIFISHLHGDHYFGLIGLISSMHLLGRNKELHIYAHKELREIVDLQLQASNTELNYPLFFHSLPEDNEVVILEDDNIKISNLILDHSIKCSGFLFEEKKRARKIIKSMVEEYSVPFDKMNSLKDGADWIDFNGNIISNSILTEANSLSYKYAFCSDTRYNESIVERIKEVDLLYHETTFMSELEDRAEQTGHATTLQAATIAKKAKVTRLLIGHYSQRYKNLEELLDETRRVFSNTSLSSAGLVCIINRTMKRILVIIFLFSVFSGTSQINSDSVRAFNCYDNGAVFLDIVPGSSVAWYFDDDSLGLVPVDTATMQDIIFFNNSDTLITKQCGSYRLYDGIDTTYCFIKCPLGSGGSQLNVRCFGDSTGMLKRVAHSGSFPYFYKWFKDGMLYSAGVNDTLLDNLVIGSYKIVISDAVGCLDSITSTVSSPSVLIFDTISTHNINCRGTNSGSIIYSVGGGRQYIVAEMYDYYVIRLNSGDTVSYLTRDSVSLDFS